MYGFGVMIDMTQCVQRSHIFGASLRSRSHPQKWSATPISLLLKKRSGTPPSLSILGSGTLLSLFSKKKSSSKCRIFREVANYGFFLTPLIVRH